MVLSLLALLPHAGAADLDNDGADDSIEVYGGTALVDLAGSSVSMTMLYCDRTLATPSSTSRYCVTYPLVVDDAYTLLAMGRAPGEWDEGTATDGGLTIELAYPNLTAPPRMMTGVQVNWTPGKVCYEGYIQARGGVYYADSGTWTYYYYPTGRFVLCTV